MDIYAEIGVETIINAGGTLTMFGGSLMSPAVTDAMAAASRSFVVMEELHLAAAKRIAALVGVEAAHVCSCATAGISLMAAACMAGSDRANIRQLPDTKEMKHKFVVQRAHRNGFDRGVRIAGGAFVQVDEPKPEAIAAAIDAETAAVYYTLAWFCTGDAVSLSQTAEVAHRAGVPLIVDAAAEVPPAEHLTRFLKEGADLVTFSGGKAICGPQATGLILGRQELVEACRLNDCPNAGIGRPMKTGKEEIVALVKAVELYVTRDHAADLVVWERRVSHVVETLSRIEHVRAWRQMPFGTGQQIPHAAIRWDEAALGITHEEAALELRAGKPRIAVQLINAQRYGFGGYTEPELRVHAHTLQDGQDVTVARRLAEILTRSG